MLYLSSLCNGFEQSILDPPLLGSSARAPAPSPAPCPLSKPLVMGAVVGACSQALFFVSIRHTEQRGPHCRYDANAI